MARWPYSPLSSDELSLLEGETIHVLSGDESDGWWIGERVTGEVERETETEREKRKREREREKERERGTEREREREREKNEEMNDRDRDGCRLASFLGRTASSHRMGVARCHFRQLRDSSRKLHNVLQGSESQSIHTHRERERRGGVSDQ